MRCLCTLVFCVFLASFPVEQIQAARILALMSFNGKSHYTMIQTLLKALASRGHDITMVGHYPLKTPVANYTDISLRGSLPSEIEQISVREVSDLGYFKVLYMFWQYQVEMCSKVYESPNLQKLIASDIQFDLIITHLFGADCFLGFSHLFKAPVISIVTSVSLPWGADRIGNVDHPAYIPNYFLPFSDRMSFWQRLVNTVFIEAAKLGHYILTELITEELTRKHLGPDVPSLSEIKRNTSLVLVNSHFSLNTPRPTVPAFVEVGGLHIQSNGNLSTYLEEYIKGAKHGVIYFCLGSIIQSDTFPSDKLQAFINAFSRLPQRFLWKMTNITGLPENIKTSEWFPQMEILRHPNTRVFITHGGQFGTQEAVFFGVPMVGIPMAFDQYLNIENCVKKGVAVQLDYESITEENILRSLKTILHDPSYKRNAERLSHLFRDRPHSPLHTAIYWTE
ncbi:UDP-glucosyltransferase 2-like isoform X2 [Periplaneta americana]